MSAWSYLICQTKFAALSFRVRSLNNYTVRAIKDTNHTERRVLFLLLLTEIQSAKTVQSAADLTLIT
jgi:hypothetical protein